jgi:hypothetical protein
LRTAVRFGRQGDRALEEGRGGGEPATRLGPRRGTFEFGGHLFIGHGRSLRAVPGAPIRVYVRIGRVCESDVGLAAIIQPGRSVDR